MAEISFFDIKKYLWLIQSLVVKVALVDTTGTRLTSDEAKNFVRARVEKINLLPSNSGISARSAHSTQHTGRTEVQHLGTTDGLQDFERNDEIGTICEAHPNHRQQQKGGT